MGLTEGEEVLSRDSGPGSPRETESTRFGILP